MAWFLWTKVIWKSISFRRIVGIWAHFWHVKPRAWASTRTRKLEYPPNTNRDGMVISGPIVSLIAFNEQVSISCLFFLGLATMIFLYMTRNCPRYLSTRMRILCASVPVHTTSTSASTAIWMNLLPKGDSWSVRMRFGRPLLIWTQNYSKIFQVAFVDTMEKKKLGRSAFFRR